MSAPLPEPGGVRLGEPDGPHCPSCTCSEPVETRLQVACDMLVRRALELVGKRTLRATRARRVESEAIPFEEAHLHYRVAGDDLDKALAGAWEMVPLVTTLHGCCGIGSAQIEAALDRYVRDLIMAREPHRYENLLFVLKQFVPAG